MQVLAPSVDLRAFYERIDSAPERVLMLDYDGTLAPFRIDPSEAVPYPGVVQALDEIAQGGMTRVVVVSGRPAEELPSLLALAQPPEIWGAHGRERLLPDGRLVIEELDADARRALAAAADLTRAFIPKGARIEQKRGSVALHWRGLPPVVGASLEAEAKAAWSSIAARGVLEILSFDAGLELRARGCTKEDAVKSVLSETGEESAIAYLGDDITDEDAFRAVKKRGLAVLVRAELRETQADLWLRPPAELLAFMLRWRVGKRPD